jgi:hypothetical protein
MTKPAKKPKHKPRSEWQQYKRRGSGLLKSEEEIASALGEEPRPPENLTQSATISERLPCLPQAGGRAVFGLRCWRERA